MTGVTSSMQSIWANNKHSSYIAKSLNLRFDINLDSQSFIAVMQQKGGESGKHQEGRICDRQCLVWGKFHTAALALFRSCKTSTRQKHLKHPKKHSAYFLAVFRKLMCQRKEKRSCDSFKETTRVTRVAELCVWSILSHLVLFPRVIWHIGRYELNFHKTLS